MKASKATVAEEPDDSNTVRKVAEAEYKRALGDLIDLCTLSAGALGYDFQVEIPARSFHTISQQIVDLEYEIRDRYAVHFRTYTLAV